MEHLPQLKVKERPRRTQRRKLHTKLARNWKEWRNCWYQRLTWTLRCKALLPANANLSTLGNHSILFVLLHRLGHELIPVVCRENQLAASVQITEHASNFNVVCNNCSYCICTPDDISIG